MCNRFSVRLQENALRVVAVVVRVFAAEILRLENSPSSVSPRCGFGAGGITFPGVYTPANLCRRVA